MLIMTDDMFQARVEPLVMNFHCKLPTHVMFDVAKQFRTKN